jgi:DNA polymerase III subunit delta
MVNYLFTGNEPALKDEAIEERKKTLLNPANQHLNFNMFYAGDDNASAIKESLCTSPFLSKTRLVVIKNFQKASKKEFEIVLSFLEKPFRSTCLIVEIDGEVRDKKDFSRLLKFTELKRFNKISPYSARTRINTVLSRNRKKMTPAAINFLIELTTDNTSALKSELEKLILYTDGRQDITRKDIEHVVGKNARDSVFDLADATVRKDAQNAVRISRDLLFQNKKRPHEILGLLAWRYRMLLEKGLVGSARDGLKKNLERILSTDLSIKSGTAPTPELALELLLVDLCRT